MNLRRKKKAWKKYVAVMAGQPSEFGKMTARERIAAMNYLKWHVRQFNRTMRKSFTIWREAIASAVEAFEGLSSAGEAASISMNREVFSTAEMILQKPEDGS